MIVWTIRENGVMVAWLEEAGVIIYPKKNVVELFDSELSGVQVTQLSTQYRYAVANI